MQIKDILNSIKKLFAKIEDTGWQTAVLTDDFKPYKNDSINMPQYRRTGNQVEVIGSVSPTNTIPGSTTQYTIFTLPEGFRPNKPDVGILCQGSAKNTWRLRVGMDGNVTFERYGSTEYVDANENAWLTFDHTFFID